ncbi:MAG: hypothetical protein Ct9H300mP31_16930 [Acidimicrobiaceae bacterium]|nr:MAG: hypothetical protein Ct9H300mP31_16930 [Acidimicrobiaceae bacterium]
MVKEFADNPAELTDTSPEAHGTVRPVTVTAPTVEPSADQPLLDLLSGFISELRNAASRSA